MKPVVVYTSPSCGYCLRAKALLKSRGIPFEEIHLGWDDEEGWRKAYERSGMKTVPQIYIDGQLVGGYTELAAPDAAGELMKRVD